MIAPTHNNAGTLSDILTRLDRLKIPVIVVDDGSTDSTSAILANWTAGSGQRRTFTHPSNCGKAAALHTGFCEAMRAGFTHGITIDTDGQLSPEDIPKLLEKCHLHPDALVIGTRDATATDYPRVSRFGRKVSNWLIKFESGRHIVDSQCGLRIYPLAFVNQTRCQSGHFGFESEIITRTAWAGLPIMQVPVRCLYFAGLNRVSHFKPVLDSLRAMRMHHRLIATAFFPVRFRNGSPGSAPPHSLPRQLLHWLNPVTAWRQIRHTKGARTRFAAGFAIGVFIANLPIYGVQTLMGLYVARRFRLHPASVVGGVNIAVPPIGPLMIACGIAVGHLLLHGAWPSLSMFHLHGEQLHQILLPMLLEWLVGSIVLGTLLGGLTFIALDLALRLVVDAPAEVSE